MPPQSRHWCFTVNNWNANDEAILLALAGSVTYIVWGYEEAPNTGTPHLQGYVIFSQLKRFPQVVAALPIGSHVEVKRGSAKEASDYCKKEGLFKEFGAVPRGPRSSLSDSFAQWAVSFVNDNGRSPTEREIAIAYPTLYLRHSFRLLDLARHLSPHPVIQEGECRDWQRELELVLGLEPDDRTIIFYVDEEGGKGKSWFQRYYFSKHPDKTQILSMGKRDDVAHAVDENKSVFFFNVPRGGMEYFNYNVVEMLKDRVVFSPKYNSRTKVFPTDVHVVVFCNEQPDHTKMTEDRFCIVTEFN